MAGGHSTTGGTTPQLLLLACRREPGWAWAPPASPPQSDERPTLIGWCKWWQGSVTLYVAVVHVAAEDQIHQAALHHGLLEARERAPATRAARCRRSPLDVWQGKGNYMPNEKPLGSRWGCQ